jgi:hypothetical protein
MGATFLLESTPGPHGGPQSHKEFPMKKLFVGVALVAAIAACKSQTNQATSDAATPAVKSEACATKCATEKSACSSEKKAECSTEKVCPATGAKIN